MPITCAVMNCTSSRSKKRKVEGITFHKFPRNKQRRAQWLAAVDRGEDWRPGNSSAICSLHFEEKAFYRCSQFQVFLNPDAVPTIFPVADSNRKISKKKPRDPSTLCSAGLLEPLVVLQEGSNLDPPKMPIVLDVTPIAVEKVKGLCPLPNAREAQVSKKSENQLGECPMEEPCSGVESISIGDVRSIKESEAQPQGIVEFALKNTMDESSSNGPKEPTKDPRSSQRQLKVMKKINLTYLYDPFPHLPDKDQSPKKKIEQNAPGTADGAQNNDAQPGVMMVNLVCPHCQKACKVCMNVKPRSTNAPANFLSDCKPNTNAPTNLLSDYKPKKQRPDQPSKRLQAENQRLHQPSKRLRDENQRLH